MRGSKVVAACIFNRLQADCWPVSSFGRCQHAYRSLYQWQKVPKLVNNAVFIVMKAYSLFQQWLPWIPITAHAAVATQRMPWGLSNTDYQIWVVM